MQNKELVTLVQDARDLQAPLTERHEAFGELVTRFQDMAYGYAYSILGNAQAAQDAAQEAFLVAYQNLDQLQEPAAFSAWLRRIVASQCSRLMRSHRTVTDDLEGTADTTDQPDPATLVERSELREQVMAAVAALPEHERTATILYYINGYSQREVATFLEVSVDAVKKRLERARRRLLQDMLVLVGEQLMEGRPSQDDRFVQEIKLSLAMEAAARDAQLAQLEPLLLDGLDVNTRTSGGQTMLHWAAERGHTEALELLLRYGADPHIRDDAGKTALQIARKQGHTEAVEVLQRAEAKSQPPPA